MPIPLIMETDAFEDGGVVPPRFGCFGDNVQPGFKFKNVPEQAASLALIFHDIDVALDRELDLPPTAGRAELLEAMDGNVIAKAAYVGRFRRPS
jgi:phosphatidylethanolamine-binding protein (PEBP) family uncharacterized protein